MDLILSHLAVEIENDGPESYLLAATKILGLHPEHITIIKILSKSLDMSLSHQFYFKITLVARTPENYKNLKGLPLYSAPFEAPKPPVKMKDRPLIVGFGPAGMFAALELIEYGLKPIIFERGKRIEERTLDVRKFIKKRILNPESNIQFGEGGAGSFSDGKLFSRRNKNTSYVNRVLQTFIKFGAPEEIGYIGKPHLGTDVLCRIVRNIRNYILERGGEIEYSAKMTNILIAKNTAYGIQLNGKKEYRSSNIYIALGHSARDTLEMMEEKGIAMQQRPISVGVRVEHPVETVNQMRYGDKYSDYEALGAATYSLSYTNRKIRRGVYTFCMCPGGEIVNASSESGLLVLNGMSYSRRSSPFSNAALVVRCHESDYPSSRPLAGIEFQKAIEQKAFIAGGETWAVPGQSLLHFLGESNQTELSQNSCKTGTVSADLRDIFPKFIIDQLLDAFSKWRTEVPLYISDQAVLLAAETRTSSPVRILRNENYESVNVKNLYPIGEGSGYTGGITSSATDALKAVTRHLE